MKLKKVNNFFGISIIVIGFLRFLIPALGTLLMLTGNPLGDSMTTFAGIVGLYQIIIAIGSLTMIFLNMKENGRAVGGYLLQLLALGIELILPGILMFIYVFFEASMYIKAGSMIREKDLVLFSKEKSEKEKMEKTDWFYNDDKK